MKKMFKWLKNVLNPEDNEKKDDIIDEVFEDEDIISTEESEIISEEIESEIPIFKSLSSFPLNIKCMSVKTKSGARNISASVLLSRNNSVITRFTIARTFINV